VTEGKLNRIKLTEKVAVHTNDYTGPVGWLTGKNYVVVISSLTNGVANILKAVILSSTRGTDSETDVHCGVIIFPLQVINYVHTHTHPFNGPFSRLPR